MQVNINPISEVQFEADITVPDEELQPHFEEAYVKFRPKADVKGFRRGKVPMPLIKRLFGEAIEQDALDTIAGDLYRKAMEDQSIHPIGQPALVDMDFKRGSSFRFKIKYEVKPNITLQKYKGLAVEKSIHPVTEKEVQAEVDHIRRINSESTPVAKVTDADHVVTGDVQELDEAGTPLIGKKTPHARFLLSDETLAQEIRDALGNAEVGGAYRASFQSHHGDHEHPANILITVTKVEKVILPEFDDTLVKKVTKDKMSGTDEFMQDLRTNLDHYWVEQANAKLNDALAQEVVRQHEFQVPDTLVDGFLDSFVADVKKNSQARTLPKNFDEPKFRDENRAYAVWQSKWLLLKERIAEVEGITVKDQEIEELAEAEAGRIGVEKSRLLQYYTSSSAATERILSEKIMSFLREHAKVTEIAEERVP